MATPDICNGDLLLVGTDEYKITAVKHMPWLGTPPDISGMAMVTASTKRKPAVVSGKIATPVTYLAAVACLPIQTIAADSQKNAGGNAMVQRFQTYVAGDDCTLQLALEETS